MLSLTLSRQDTQWSAHEKCPVYMLAFPLCHLQYIQPPSFSYAGVLLGRLRLQYQAVRARPVSLAGAEAAGPWQVSERSFVPKKLRSSTELPWPRVAAALSCEQPMGVAYMPVSGRSPNVDGSIHASLINVIFMQLSLAARVSQFVSLLAHDCASRALLPSML